MSAMRDMSRAIRHELQDHGPTLAEIPTDVLGEYVTIMAAFHGDLHAELERRELDTPSEWYVSGPHARRALGYLGVSLAARGYLDDEFEQPLLLALWGEALEATMEVDDVPASPIGAP